MKGSKRYGNPDGNHLNIKHAWEKLGWAVADTKPLGNGIPDLLVSKLAVATFWVEVKNPLTKGKLRPSQESFKQRWKGCPIYVIETVEQVQELSTSLIRGTPMNLVARCTVAPEKLAALKPSNVFVAVEEPLDEQLQAQFRKK